MSSEPFKRFKTNIIVTPSNYFILAKKGLITFRTIFEKGLSLPVSDIGLHLKTFSISRFDTKLCGNPHPFERIRARNPS
jgi:hypothetical protein